MRGACAPGCPQGKDLLQPVARLDLHWDGGEFEAEMGGKEEFRIIQFERELGSL